MPYRKVLMVGKNHCQITAFDIEKNREKSYPSFSNSSICYFDFVPESEKHRLYVNQLPGYFSEISFGNNSIFLDDLELDRQHESSVNLPVNAQTISTDFNYYYSFEVDYNNEKIYGVTTKSSIESDKLFVVDIKTKDYAIILSNLESPNHLCLDPTRNLLFISQATSVSKN